MNNLKKIRNERNMTQCEVAQALNISQSAYSFYEKGRNEPNVQILLALSKIFDVSIDYLLGNTNFAKNELIIPEERKEGVQLLINLPEINYQNILGQMMAYAKICGLRW